MKDIKQLYLAARNGGSKNSIANYTEAVQDLFNGNPNDYILQLEYIIQSDIGLQTFKPFVEKNGLPIAFYDEVMEMMEKCVSKCKLGNKDDTPYKEAVAYLEDFRKKYVGCFMMESYFHDQLPTNYVETYYGSNQKGISNRKLISGMITKFGEAAIPDVLITADCLGNRAMKTALQFIESHDTFGNPVVYEWVLEAVKNLSSDLGADLIKLESGSVGRIAYEARNRNQKLYREAVITGNEDIMMEYSENEINAIADFISYNEYKLTWADELGISVSDLQKEIYSLYEEYDGMLDDDAQLMSESMKETKITASSIVKKMVSLKKKILPMIQPEIKKAVSNSNKGKKLLSPKVQYPTLNVVFRDSRHRDKFLLKKLVTKNIDDITEGSTEFVNCVELGIRMEIGTTISTLENKSFQLYVDTIHKALAPLVKQGIITFKKNDTYYVELTYLTIPVYMSRAYLLDEINGGMFESIQSFEEFVADSVIPMLPSINTEEPMEEAQWLVNTRNKKTGDIPGYIKKNHNVGYGEDDRISSNHGSVDSEIPSSESEPTLDDFKRPSVEDMSQSYSGLDDDKKTDSNTPLTSEERKAINNYYYYTYNNSLNKNSDSFNRDNSTHDDHSSTIKKTVDDHSTDKRINSDDVNNPSGDVEETGSYAEGVGTIILAAPFVLSAGAIIAGMVSSKIMKAKYRKKMLKVLSDIVGTTVNDETKYISAAHKEISGLLKSKQKDIASNFYKFDEIGEEIELDPHVFFTFKTDKSGNLNTDCSQDDLLICSDELFIGLIKKSDIKSVMDSLNKMSDDIKFCITESDNLPGDDSGGDWCYYTKAGICDGGPEDCPDDSMENGGNKWIQDQFKKIEESGYVSYCVSVTINAKEFLISRFKDSSKTESVSSEEDILSEAVGDADDNRPESDHPVKDVLTDIDRNLTKKQQSAKKVVQNVQNAGRAFAKPAVRTQQWISNMVSNWKDADENNIKERMADPHARSNLFSAIKKAIVGGSLLKAGLLLNPVFLFLSVTKGIGKNKREFRLRNEMIGEFKTEIEVIDEKIKDADRVGDNKEKYKLMRFKNELNKKLLRVGGPKGWSKII